MGSEDSTGKSKIVESKARLQSLLGVFVVGVCLGLLVAERAYIQKGSQILKPKRILTGAVDAGRNMVSHLHAHKAEGAGMLGSMVGSAGHDDGELKPYPDTSPPRNDLEEVLRRVAPSKEVLVAVANKNTLWDGMLDTFCTGFKRAGVKNHLLLALDEETKKWAESKDVNAYLLKLQVHKSQEGTGDNHAVSAMKFGILKRFVELGYSVLLSDVDIVVLQNPFDHLYRDSDVEGMTDGFDERTAYGGIEGFDDPSMGWARFAQYYKHFNLNSGLFWLKGNAKCTNLMARLEDRLSKEKYWDQTAYNEEIFFLSHGSYKSPQVSVRVMEIDAFMNTKRLFKDIRLRPKSQRPPMPVTVHVNYHPDKHERMKAIVKYYVDGDEHALDKFPGGSEPGSK